MIVMSQKGDIKEVVIIVGRTEGKKELIFMCVSDTRLNALHACCRLNICVPTGMFVFLECCVLYIGLC